MAELDDGTPSSDRPRRRLALAWILERADELRASGRESRPAFDQALQEYVESGLGRQAIVDVLMRILERAHALREGGTDPGDAIAQALDHGASDEVAAVARAMWIADLHKDGSEASS